MHLNHFDLAIYADVLRDEVRICNAFKENDLTGIDPHIKSPPLFLLRHPDPSVADHSNDVFLLSEFCLFTLFDKIHLFESLLDKFFLVESVGAANTLDRLD